MFDSYINLSSAKPFFQLTRRKPKTHDYRRLVRGEDYVLEMKDESNCGYMTGQGNGIKRGDYLVLANGHGLARYQIEEIDYYSNPSDMWMALVKQVAL
jgi:hypothetical protein